jgi:hypothetical protein
MSNEKTLLKLKVLFVIVSFYFHVRSRGHSSKVI